MKKKVQIKYSSSAAKYIKKLLLEVGNIHILVKLNLELNEKYAVLL